MTIIFMTIIMSLFLALVFLLTFIWATRSGQYDDLVTPGHRALLDEKSDDFLDNKEEKQDG